jgi:hypothetical protein
VLVNLAVDLSYLAVDPRLSVEGKAADDEQKPGIWIWPALLAIVLLSFLPAPSAPTTLTALTRPAA